MKTLSMPVDTVKTNKGTPPGGHYSQGKIFGNLLYTAGQVPVDPKSGRLVNTSIEEETRQTLDNLAEIAKTAGTSLNNALKITVFITDMDLFSRFNSVYAEYFPENPPARSTVEVGRLLRAVHIEIDAIIAIP